MSDTHTPVWNEGATEQSIKNAFSVAASGNDETTVISLADFVKASAVLTGAKKAAGRQRTDFLGLMIGAIVPGTNPDGDITVDIFRGIQKFGEAAPGIVYESVVDSTLTFPIVIIGKTNTTQYIYVPIVECPHIKIKLTNAATNVAITFDIDIAARAWRKENQDGGSVI